MGENRLRRSFSRLNRPFGLGWAISFAGSLPIGTMNVAVLQFGLLAGWRRGLQFSLGIAAVEVLFVAFSLAAIERIWQRKRLLRRLEWATLALFIALAAGSFWAALHPALPGTPSDSEWLSAAVPPLLLGMAFRAINPSMMPFWVGWHSILAAKDRLPDTPRACALFAMGAGAGTVAAHGCYLAGGEWAADSVRAHEHWLHFAIGLVFAAAAAAQGWRLLAQRAV